jgi:uncharacterized protein YbbC (DUF1343 family)/CubicO group peptidase (beta-lactamase class C family)
MKMSRILLLLFVLPALGLLPRLQLALAAPFYQEKLAEIDQAISGSISSNKMPGGVFWLEHRGVVYHKAYGNRAVTPKTEAMTEDTIFDAASLTKVLATTPSLLILYEHGLLDFDAPVAKYLAAFAQNGKEHITIKQLMTHISGLRSGIGGAGGWSGYDGAIRTACAETPVNAPGTVFHYSDINFIVLGEVVRVLSHKSLNEFAAENVFQPLKMVDTGYLPPKSKLGRIAPTEGKLRGEVHDPTARRMGGVAGHAGVFTTAADVARYARMLLNNGELEGVRILKPETVALMRSVETPPQIDARRGLGWDIDSAYAGPRGAYFPVGSYGHTGWTGTSIWLDPFSDSFVMLLSNRNHPTESGNVLALRRRLGTLSAEAVPDFNFVFVPGALERREIEEPKPALPTAQVLNGIDVLKRDKFAPLKGLRVGLITNHTGADRERNPTIDLLHKAAGVQFVALFSPEHGIRGALDEKVADSTDQKTGLPVYSLYGERRSPTPEQLSKLDALVFDIQDVGCRFYTYISTMGNCLEAAGKTGKQFFVLDRVNPISGTQVEGPVLQGEESFTAWHKIPVRPGMTVGELARMFNEERSIHAKLTVVPVENWQRGFYFDQTSLPWINPSPNMRSLTEAVFYPGIGLLETTSLSVGRGTDTPFEVIGAPYIQELRLASELNGAGVPGVRFLPVQFTPTASVHKGQLCKGVSLVVTDRAALPSVDLGVTIASTLQRLYPKEFGLDKFNRLLVHKPTIDAIREQKPLGAIKSLWTADLEEFRARREKFLIYH